MPVLQKRNRQSDAEHGRRQADSDHRVTPISECAVHGPTSIEQFESITFLASWHLEIPPLEGLCSGGRTDPETEPVMHYDRVEFQSEAYSRTRPANQRNSPFSGSRSGTWTTTGPAPRIGVSVTIRTPPSEISSI